jgi:hypothetical protein
MYAYEIPGIRFSLPAGGAVARCRFVSAANDAAIQATAATHVIGASMNEVTAAEIAANGRIVEISDGIVMVEAASAITSGAAVYSNAEGKATAEGTNVAGIAITAATGAGQLVAVKI